jgi:hypothetical protein
MNAISEIEANAQQPTRALLAGPDTLYFSFEAQVSEAKMARLDVEKEMAMQADRENAVHRPEWLGARVLPGGAKGGYRILIETAGFTVKVLGVGIRNRPGLYVEMRSLFLHMHPNGPAGACEAAIAWVREHLLVDQDAETVARLVSFKAAKLSRADLHIDWQGGYHPQLDSASDELRRFIRPGKTKRNFHGSGQTPTGYVFGKRKIQARIYNKTLETAERANEAYAALLTARCGEAYDPSQEVWRLEFELDREGAKGFKLYAKPEFEDDEAELEADLAAEELEHMGTLPRFFARMGEVMTCLMTHWLRFVEDNGTANRSRWPLHPTWAILRDAFPRLAQQQALPLDDDGRAVVRSARCSGKARILRRLQLGVLSSLEIEDASPTSAALHALQRRVVIIAEREMDKIAAKCARYESQGQPIPRWVWHGMEERYTRVEQIEHRVRMLLGVFGSYGVLPLEFKPAHTIGDLLVQHLDDLEHEADQKGGVQQVLEDHFAKVYKVRPRLAA